MFIQFIWPDKSQILAIVGCQHEYARIETRIYLIISDKYPIKCTYKYKFQYMQYIGYMKTVKARKASIFINNIAKIKYISR
jgi:hypothetical protein